MVIIPDTISTGEYTLRAYTNWMKNFLPENCFIKELKIFNALITRRLTGTGNKLPALSDSVRSSDIKQIGFEADVNNSTDSEIIELNIRADMNFRAKNVGNT